MPRRFVLCETREDEARSVPADGQTVDGGGREGADGQRLLVQPVDGVGRAGDHV